MQPISKHEERYHEEVQFLTDTLAQETKARDASVKNFEAATAKWWKLVQRSGMDAPESKAEVAAREARQKAMSHWQRHERLVTNAAEKLALLDTPEAMERYVGDREKQANQLAKLRETKRAETGREPRPEKVEMTDDLTARILKLVVDDGLGITTVAKTLNEDGTPVPGRAKLWYAVTIHNIVKKATGKPVSELRGMTFDQYVKKTLAQEKPHHVVTNVIDWLFWKSNDWEELVDCTGSSSSQRTLRHIPTGQTVEVDIAWVEKAGR